MLHHPCILVGPQQRGRNQSRPKRGRKCYITPAFLGVPNNGYEIKAGPKEGGNATSPLHSRGSLIMGTKSKRAQKRAQMLHHPCILGGPQQRRQNQSGPKRGRKCYITSTVSGVANKGDKIKAGPKEDANATSPLHSCRSPTKGTKSKPAKRGRKCYITPAFSGVPNKGDKIKAGPKVGGNATSPLHSRGSPTTGTKSKRAQILAEMLHHPCILRGPQQRGRNQSGPKRGRKCCITLHSRGSPTNGIKSKRAQKRAEMLHHACILASRQ